MLELSLFDERYKSRMNCWADKMSFLGPKNSGKKSSKFDVAIFSSNKSVLFRKRMNVDLVNQEHLKI